jgi:ribosomal protein S15P/S13E
MANLQEISRKYRVSDNYLNSKEDGLLIVAASLVDLANELNSNKIDENRKQSIIEKMERLAQFCKDVKNSGF